MIRRVAFQALTTGFLAVPLLILPVIIGHAGDKEGLAVFAIGISGASILTAFVDFGSFLLLAKETARYPGLGINKILIAVLRVSLLAASVFLVAGIALAMLGRSQYPNAESYGLVLMGIAIGSPARVSRGVFHGRRSFALDSLVSGSQDLVFAVTGVTVYLTTGSVRDVFITFVLSRVYGAVAALGLIRREMGTYEVQSETPSWALSIRGTVTEAWPYVFNGLLAIIYLRSDLLVLAALGSALDVAAYEAGSLIVFRANVMVQVLTAVSLPSLSSLYARRGSLDHLVRSLGAAALAAAVPIAVLTMLFSDTIIRVLFGPDFSSSARVLAVLSLVIPTKFIGNILDVTLTACDRQHSRAQAMSVAAGLNLSLNIVFIPFYGLWAAVWSTVATEVLLMGFLAYRLASVNGVTFNQIRTVVVPAAVITVLGVGFVALELDGLGAVIALGIAGLSVGRSLVPALRTIRVAL